MEMAARRPTGSIFAGKEKTNGAGGELQAPGASTEEPGTPYREIDQNFRQRKVELFYLRV